MNGIDEMVPYVSEHGPRQLIIEFVVLTKHLTISKTIQNESRCSWTKTEYEQNTDTECLQTRACCIRSLSVRDASSASPLIYDVNVPTKKAVDTQNDTK